MRRAQADAQGFRTAYFAVKIINKDIIVTAGLHFGERNFLPVLSHMVDVYKLGIFRPVPAFQHLKQRNGGIGRGHGRNALLHGKPMQCDEISHRCVLYRAGIENIVNQAVFHQRYNIVALGGVWHRFYRNAHTPDGLRRAGCGVQLQP